MALHPQLARIFSQQAPQVSFLSKLPAHEQVQLAEQIQKRIHDEHSMLFSVIGLGSNMLPDYLKARLAEHTLGPKVTAYLLSYIPVGRAVKVARLTSERFLIRVAHHLPPEQAAPILQGLSEEVLLNVGRQLLAEGQYQLLSQFLDHMAERRVARLAERLGDVQQIVKLAHGMRNQERLVGAARFLSDEYLLKLMQGIAYYEYYALAALVGEHLPFKRQVDILVRMRPVEAARLAVHYHPETIAKIMSAIDDELALNIALKMPVESLGHLFNCLPIADINRIFPYLGLATLLGCVPYVNALKVENNWDALSRQLTQLLSPR